MNVRAIAPEEYEAVQQSRTIKGTVVDKNGEAVIGANVVVKGTSKGYDNRCRRSVYVERCAGKGCIVRYFCRL